MNKQDITYDLQPFNDEIELLVELDNGDLRPASGIIYKNIGGTGFAAIKLSPASLNSAKKTRPYTTKFQPVETLKLPGVWEACAYIRYPDVVHITNCMYGRKQLTLLRDWINSALGDVP